MGGDAPEVFEFAKEAFDKVTLLVKPRREADRTFAQSFGRDIGQAAAIRDIISEPVGIISFVAKHHSAGLDISKQFSGGLDVVRVARRDHELDRQAMPIGQTVDFFSKIGPGFVLDSDPGGRF